MQKGWRTVSNRSRQLVGFRIGRMTSNELGQRPTTEIVARLSSRAVVSSLAYMLVGECCFLRMLEELSKNTWRGSKFQNNSQIWKENSHLLTGSKLFQMETELFRVSPISANVNCKLMTYYTDVGLVTSSFPLKIVYRPEHQGSRFQAT